ncbi:MAG: hypothetical protein LBM99_04465 [Bacillales bacterium]|jgi:hypothetical protein|nr:hypothetical protein [Bacillales bacterium]
MSVNRELALKLWNDVYGNNLWVTDCFGTWIYRDDYGDINTTRIRPNGDGKRYNYGWNIDHIFPISRNGKDAMNNYEPMHHLNNKAKSDDLNFNINGKPYQVIKCDICGANGLYGKGIKDQQTNKRVDWKGVQGRYYISN